MDNITYNIPLELVQEFSGRRIIVRAQAPAEIARRLAGQDVEKLQYVQLRSADIDPDDIELLADWGPGIPLDIVLDDPGADFPLLYNFSKLTDHHPLRITIPVKPGFIKAVKLASALRFDVKIDPLQPDAPLIDEMAEALDIYLYRSTVSQPVEYFHSLFLSRFDQVPVSLWFVQEQDPENFRFVTDDGAETVSPRFAGAHLPGVADVRDLPGRSTSMLSKHECDTCEYAATCRGYFKWPDSSYDCAGVKSIFASIDSAASRLREDVAAAAGASMRGVA